MNRGNVLRRKSGSFMVEERECHAPGEVFRSLRFTGGFGF